MKARLLSPDKGYRNDWLWLPLRRIGNLSGIQNSLTFHAEQGPPLKAWSIEGEHLVVPREYIPYSRWADLPFEVVDIAKTNFPVLRGVQTLSTLQDATQHTGFNSMLEGSGVLSLACGKGKTVVSLHAWAKTQSPGLVVVHTIDLEEQWRERITQHTNIKEGDIGRIRGPKMDWEKPITVASIQTLASRAESGELPVELGNHFGAVIYDEVHHLGAPYFNTTADIGKGIRWGLSATPARNDGLDMLYQYHLGPILYQNLEQDIIPETWFVRTGVRLLAQDYPKVRDGSGDLQLASLVTWLGEHEQRNDLVCSWLNDLLQDHRKPLVLSQRVEHLQTLYDRYKDATNLKVGLIHGKIKGEERKNILRNCDLIFATQQLAKEGLDRKDLDSIVLASPFTDESLLRQVLGRVQRPALNKNTPVLIVFEDSDIKPMHEMCKKMRHILTTLTYPFEIARS